MRAGLTGRVRGFIGAFSNRKTFSASAVARQIGEPNALMVQAVFADLVERGEIIKKAPGRYSYKGVSKLWQKEGPMTCRIWRAMHVSKNFSAGEIAVLADATRNFVYKQIRVLAASGEITAAGKRRNVNEQLENTFKIKNRDAFYLKHLIGNTSNHSVPQHERGNTV